jgi:hypothetical protein
VLAIVSGFAADKILRSMIYSALKKLEQKAEKMKESKKQWEGGAVQMADDSRTRWKEGAMNLIFIPARF